MVRGFIASGMMGTVNEIAEATGVKWATTYSCLRLLEERREAGRVAERMVTGITPSVVWGPPCEEMKRVEEDVVVVALRARFDIEVVWGMVVGT